MGVGLAAVDSCFWPGRDQLSIQSEAIVLTRNTAVLAHSNGVTREETCSVYITVADGWYVVDTTCVDKHLMNILYHPAICQSVASFAVAHCVNCSWQAKMIDTSLGNDLVLWTGIPPLVTLVKALLNRLLELLGAYLLL